VRYGGPQVGWHAWLAHHWKSTSLLLRAALTLLIVILAVINAVGVYGRLSAAHLTVHAATMAATEQQASTVGARIEEQAHVVCDLDRRIALIATKLSQKRRRKVTPAPYMTTALHGTRVSVQSSAANLVINTGHDRGANAGSLAPLAIGMTVTLNIMMGGPLTGAAFNPARALGPMVATGNFTHVWLYMAAPIVGAIVAAILHTGLTRLAEDRPRVAAPASVPAE
jgi:glycerol uptake facilitator-like aquaporin